MDIMGPASVSRDTVVARLISSTPHPRFLAEILPALWDAGQFYGVDPVVMVAQSYKETGGGNFGGNVKPEFCNPCGLKNGQSLFPGVDDGDRPLAHARFPNWPVGAHAHAQHLRAYAGVPLPESSAVLSPRYHLVTSLRALKLPPTVVNLSRRWAPSSTYGSEIVTLARTLGYTGI
jgi:hypothetical protein